MNWLPYVQPSGDPRIVYLVHQYAPYRYTHQSWDDLQCTYPGLFDMDWDGRNDLFNRAWLEDLLSTVDTFVGRHGVPVSVNEFGVGRWVPVAAAFMADQMDLFDAFDTCQDSQESLWKSHPGSAGDEKSDAVSHGVERYLTGRQCYT